MVPPLLLLLLALLSAFAPLPTGFVEHRYSEAAYLAWQRLVTPVSNAVPFALFDPIVIGLAIAVAGVWVRAVRAARPARRWRPIGAAAWQTIAVAAAVYLWFVASWGLNYQRESMLVRLRLSSASPATEAVERLGVEAVARLNALHDGAHADGWPQAGERPPMLAQAYVETQRLVLAAGGGRDRQAAATTPRLAVPGRPKQTVFGPWFRWTSVDGMVNPFALEVLVNPDLLPMERPFVFAHEWAHLAGYADESEASFVGFLTCLRAGRAAEYSAWLALYWQIAGELPRAAVERLAGPLQPGPRADLRAILARLRRGGVPALQHASWQVYDQYLRANRVEGGMRSYGLVIRLVAGTRGMWDERNR